ncbi:hypothetical protein ACWGE0_29655 [Lentzea sp. NPDC054927]
MEVRVGGLYVLERISKDSVKDRRFVQVTVGSFVRNRSPWAVGAPGGPEHPTPVVDQDLPWLRITKWPSEITPEVRRERGVVDVSTSPLSD